MSPGLSDSVKVGVRKRKRVRVWVCTYYYDEMCVRLERDRVAIKLDLVDNSLSRQ